MMDPNDRDHDDKYGHWPALAGIAACGVIIWLMFALATGFS